MAFIVQNIALSDTRLQIGAEEIIRGLPFGTQWTKIRVGVRIFVHGTATMTADFSLGVCQGSKGKAAPDCVDAVGAFLGSSYLAPYTYTTSAGAAYYSIGSGATAWRKTGLALQTSGTSQTTACLVASPYANTNLSAVYLDMTKTSTGMSFGFWIPNSSGSVMTNITRFQHLVNMENDSVSGYSSMAAFGPLAFSSPALWDSALFSWSRSMPVIDVHDFNVSRFY